MIQRLIKFIRFDADRATDKEIIAGIKQGISFKGAKLLILVLAIFVASLGLNTNSTAVIIGAMLISPLMGPIIGLGLGVGIADFDMLKRSFKHYIIATVFSIVTATIYFLLTPIAEAQSELLARTSPTIYDVMIALCGGLAGIIALSSKSQRSGNAIPGVAIATALMPPLCTVGFFIAKGDWSLATGAFYLYLINSVFIAFATFIGARTLRFKRIEQANPVLQKRTMHSIIALALIVMIPAVFTTITLMNDTLYTNSVNEFIHKEFKFQHTDVIAKNVNLSTHEVTVTLFGKEIDSTAVRDLQSRLDYYGLKDTKLIVKQNSLNVDEIRNNLSSAQTKLSAEIINLNQQIEGLQKQLKAYEQLEDKCTALSSEIKVLYPQIEDVRVAVSSKNLLVLIQGKLKNTETTMLNNWLKVRCPGDSIQVSSVTFR